EHLLFLGTAKFPKENEYSAYLQDHSGWSNAYTDSENTNYHFEVDAPAFEGAIDRFAQFFIAPLFDPSCTDRELKAVDSEHKKNLQADAWRLQQVDAELAAPEHPYHKFGTGSSETLKDRVSEDGQTVIPTRDRVMAFYKEYYSANLMRVALVGPQSLDTLESWLTTYFSPIP
ncbi:insulin-degrading enzyme, partial [Caulochytrium protostelioides]